MLRNNSWRTRTDRCIVYTAWEFFLFFFFHLLFLVSHIIYYPLLLFVSILLFFFFRLYFRSYFCSPPSLANLCYSELFVYSSPIHVFSFEKDTRRKKCIFIYCTNRLNAREEIRCPICEIPLACSFNTHLLPPLLAEEAFSPEGAPISFIYT